MTHKEYVAAPGGVFLDPKKHPPPRGAKILMLNPSGVCVMGHWDPWFVAWCPLPIVPPELKERVR